MFVAKLRVGSSGGWSASSDDYPTDRLPGRGSSDGGVRLCGYARLDDRVAGGSADNDRGDLHRLLGLYLDGGIEAICRCNGAFGVAIWDPRIRTLTAVRDPLGLAPLYYTAASGLISLSDNPDELQQREEVDQEFIAGFIVGGGPPSGSSVWSRVSPVPAGSFIRWANDTTRVTKYWSPLSFEERTSESQGSAQEFRRLLRESLKTQIDGNGRTWAHLSGGHDSSSVVCMASLMAERSEGQGLGGTLTVVDSFGSGDESVYSDLVVRRYGLLNERVENIAPWLDDGEAPPRTPLPTRDYPFYARDRIAARKMRQHGATSLLSGIGPDIDLPFTVLHAADLFWTARVSEAVRLVFEWSVARGSNFWTTLPQQLVMPLVPFRARLWAHQRKMRAPSWLRPEFVRNHGYIRNLAENDVHKGGPGRFVAALLDNRFASLGGDLDHWMLYQGIETRHPLLYRPLVELCLTLPYHDRMDVRAPKPVLRHALDGVLPDAIVARRRKGAAILPRVCFAFAREHRRIQNLLKHSTLAEIGVIDPKRALAAVEAAAAGRLGFGARRLYHALSLETWFAVRSGRYASTAVPLTERNKQ